MRLVEVRLEIIPSLFADDDDFGDASCMIGAVDSKLYNGPLNNVVENAVKLPYLTTHYFELHKRTKIEKTIDLTDFNTNMMLTSDFEGNDPVIVINGLHAPGGTQNLWVGRVLVKVEVIDSVRGYVPFN